MDVGWNYIGLAANGLPAGILGGLAIRMRMWLPAWLVAGNAKMSMMMLVHEKHVVSEGIA